MDFLLPFVLCVCLAHAFAATFPSFRPQNNPYMHGQTAVYIVAHYASIFVASIVHNVYRVHAETSAVMRLLWTQATLVVIAGVADRDFITWCLVLACAVFFYRSQ